MLRLCLLLVLTAGVTAEGCGDPETTGVELGGDFECVERPDDATGYLPLICQYLVAHYDAYPVDPNRLTILGVTPGDQQTVAPAYDTADHAMVSLSCCYTGDLAFIHVPSQQVVDFFLGAL